MLINSFIYRSVSRVKIIFSLVILLLTFTTAHPQVKNVIPPLKVKKGSYVYLQDSIYYFNRDTILYPETPLFPDSPEDIRTTRLFYDSLKVKAYRGGFTRRIYDLTIVLPPDKSTQDIKVKNNNYYPEEEGKTIREINITSLAPFGTSINSPQKYSARGFSEFMNKSHFNTRNIVIRNYLLFRQGERLSNFDIRESERILRKLKYIDDAKIIVVPVDDETVDIEVITRDVYSLGLFYEVRGLKSGTAEIFERSFLGLGHDLVLSFPYDYYKDYYGFGYGLSYNIRNIKKSLINASLSYSNALGKEYYDLSIQRSFLTAKTKFAGGFNIRETYTSDDLDSLEVREPVEFNNLDLWLGRSFLIDSVNMTRFVISARHINNNVYTRPDITSTSFYSLQRYKLYMASMSLVNEQFFKTNLIYNYGRTEDIPYGAKISLTYGKEFNEFSKRDYFGMQIAAANFPGKAGYFYASGNLGLFTRDFLTEQGTLDLSFKYISNLTSAGRYRFRYFANVSLTRGFQRYNDEYLRVDEKSGIRGFSNDSIRPDQRLVINLETVSFTPHYLYGFRFAVFGFTDIALISRNNHIILKDNLVTEIGIGLRIRNDNLIFKTIQMRLSFFPFTPPYSEVQYLNLTGEKILTPPDLNPGYPGIIRFR